MTEPSVNPTLSGTDRTPDPTLGALVNDLTTQVPELIRSELRLAQAEVAQKGKRAGLGIGMFSGAGLLAFFGLGTVIAAIVLALSLAMDGWIAALIVAVVLFAGAGVLALLGKNQVEQAAPPVPEKAVAGVKEDIATVKGQRS
jgi:MFS family permease